MFNYECKCLTIPGTIVVEVRNAATPENSHSLTPKWDDKSSPSPTDLPF